MEFKRDNVKWIRDHMKSKYKEKEPCYICGETTNIELHHLYSVADMWHSWLSKNKITINSDNDVISNRQQFVADNSEKLSNDNLFSLCKTHHSRLHQIYGKSYSDYIGEKVRIWLHKQKEKFGEEQK